MRTQLDTGHWAAEQLRNPASDRRDFLVKAGTSAAALGILSATGGTAFAAPPSPTANAATGADNFYVSDKVTVRKVTFKNQYRMEMLIPMATTAFQGIRGLHPEQARSVDANGVPTKIDTCFAYGRERAVVKMLWPQHSR